MSVDLLQSQIDCLRDKMEMLITQNDDLTNIKIIAISQKLDSVLNLYYEAILETNYKKLLWT